MKKKSLIINLTAFGLMIISIFLFVSTNNKNQTAKTVYITPSYAFDINNLNELVGFGDYVFVGYVEKMTGTNYDASIPRTCFDVTVIDNIKGSLPFETVQVQKSGGLSKDASQFLLFENDDMPVENEYYVFTVRDSDGDGVYVASGPNTTALIQDISLDTPNDSASDSSLFTKDAKINFKNSDTVKKYITAYQNEVPYK